MGLRGVALSGFVGSDTGGARDFRRSLANRNRVRHRHGQILRLLKSVTSEGWKTPRNRSIGVSDIEPP